MTEGRRATRKDVARRAGVSVAVVSYALNGRAPVAPETKRRVLEAVAELGYQPNVTAQALKSGSARTIALIVPDGMNPFFTELALAAESAARERGCALYITTSPDDQATTVSRFREFRARQVDGVLAVPRHSIDPVELDAVGLPWVLFNSSVPVPGVASLGVDLYRGGLEAAGHLLGHGHRGVAFAGVTGEARHRGWLDACAAAGVEPGPAVTASFDREGGYRAGRELLALPELPPAVFAASDMIAVGLLRALHEAGVRVPEDVACVSFDGSWESEYSWPPLTTVRQPVTAMAEAAVALLLGSARPEPGHRDFLGELIPRASCGPHPA